MEELELVLSLATAAIGFMATAATFVIKFIKSARAKRIAEGVIQISNAVLSYIGQAERFTGYSGQEKKEYVMTRANNWAIEHGIRFNACLVSEKVEEFVKLTKEVNKREKDKGKIKFSVESGESGES